jgi:hypothetical protein
MDKKELDKLPRKPLLPGYESGRYEPARQYDRSELRSGFQEGPRGELRKPPLEDPVRRDNRVSVRISGQDMSRLHRLALTEGLPLQSLIASIVHRYASTLEGGQHAVTDTVLSDLPLPVDATISLDTPLLSATGNNADLS